MILEIQLVLYLQPRTSCGSNRAGFVRSCCDAGFFSCFLTAVGYFSHVAIQILFLSNQSRRITVCSGSHNLQGRVDPI